VDFFPLTAKSQVLLPISLPIILERSHSEIGTECAFHQSIGRVQLLHGKRPHPNYAQILMIERPAAPP
jgi:hypothetical protein